MAFLKIEKPKQFTFIPRFYDKRKEELNQRIETIRKEIEPTSDENYRPNIRGRMHERHEALYGVKAKPGKSLISKWVVVVIYIGLVLVIVYMIIKLLAALQ
ncbi:MAG: hypothetical protein J7L89_07275 [Bacteroidales bacterium]|nr:hypothetical protein [Bacteroidales bacterium]